MPSETESEYDGPTEGLFGYWYDKDGNQLGYYDDNDEYIYYDVPYPDEATDGDESTWCAEGCEPGWQGDAYCDRPCYNPACDFDHGDCDGDGSEGAPCASGAQCDSGICDEREGCAAPSPAPGGEAGGEGGWYSGGRGGWDETTMDDVEEMFEGPAGDTCPTCGAGTKYDDARHACVADYAACVAECQNAEGGGPGFVCARATPEILDDVCGPPAGHRGRQVRVRQRKRERRGVHRVRRGVHGRRRAHGVRLHQHT